MVDSIQAHWRVFGVFPFILILVVMILIAFSAYMILGGAAKRYSKLKNEIGPGFIRSSLPFLQIWETRRAFSDMSSEIPCTTELSFFGGRWSHARGTVRSLYKREDKWIAFSSYTRGGAGRIDLWTSSSDFSLEYSDNLGTFRVGGIVTGYISSKSDVLDKSQRPIGHIQYHRAHTPMGSRYNASLEIGAGTVAEISYISDLGDRLWKPPALVQKVSRDISSNDAEWVLAVIAMRLYSHCRTKRLI
jgi:hypothetical protein